MHLLIIGHTAHYLRDNRIVGWGPTVKEVNWLARPFDKLTHLACFHPGPAPDSALPYDTDKINFVAVPPSGGLSLRDKLSVIRVAPQYYSAINKYLRQADVIQVRGPGPLGLFAMLMSGFMSHKIHWTKYAGNWGEDRSITPSFAFQRWWLKKGFTHGPVTVNGKWPDSPKHLYSFDNPSLNLEEIGEAYQNCTEKELTSPIRLIFIGRLETDKGAGRCLEIVHKLRSYFEVHLDVLGNGPEFSNLQDMSISLDIKSFVSFHGWVSHELVKSHLAESHFILLPSTSEGWPKVLSEAMAYGVVPIASDVSAIPQILSEVNTGFALPPSDLNQYVDTILDLVKEPVRWKNMILAGIYASPRFTYEQYLLKLDDMFHHYYGTSPMNQSVVHDIRTQFKSFNAN